MTTNVTGLGFDETATIVVEALNPLDSTTVTFETTKLDMQEHGVMFEYDEGSSTFRRAFVPWPNVVVIYHGV